MAVLLKYALKNDTFREVIESPRHSTGVTNIHPDGITYYSTMFKSLPSAAVTLSLIHIFVTTSKKLGLEVIECVRKQLKTLETAEIASESWESYGEVVLADSLQEAVALVDVYKRQTLHFLI